MQYLEVNGAVRPLKWSLGVKWLILRGFVCIRDGLYLNVRVTADRGERAV